MRPRNFQVAVAVRLGRPVLPEEISCSLCMQTIDVFGDHAACCTNLSCHEPCESYAASKKHAKYDNDFKRSGFEFAAMVFESTGGVNTEGLEVLRQLFRFAAKHEGQQLSVYCGRAWARLACNLQSSVSQAILNRACCVGGREKDIGPGSLPFVSFLCTFI